MFCLRLPPRPDRFPAQQAAAAGLPPLSWQPWSWREPPPGQIATAFVLAAQIAGLVDLPVLLPLPAGQLAAQRAAARAAAAAADPALALVGQALSAGWAARGLLFAAAAVLGPASETALFQGFVLPRLAGCLPPWGAVAAAAGVAALAHPGQAFSSFVAGVLFGAVSLRAGSLWPALFMHGAWNAVSLCAAWLAVQGAAL